MKTLIHTMYFKIKQNNITMYIFHLNSNVHKKIIQQTTEHTEPKENKFTSPTYKIKVNKKTHKLLQVKENMHKNLVLIYFRQQHAT